MSGAPCFAGTRVPIQNLIDYLEGGDSIDDFLDGFPSVSREQVIATLRELMHLGPNDPAPVPPPLPKAADGEKKTDASPDKKGPETK